MTDKTLYTRPAVSGRSRQSGWLDTSPTFQPGLTLADVIAIALTLAGIVILGLTLIRALS
jgi:hypothetical protein